MKKNGQTLQQQLAAMSPADRKKWELIAKRGPHPVVNDREGDSYQRARNSREVRPDDSVTTPDWDEIDRVTAILQDKPTTDDFESARRYVGDTINLTNFQRILIAAMVLLSPRLSQRDVAAEFDVSQQYVQKQYKKALAKIRDAPPAFARRCRVSQPASV